MLAHGWAHLRALLADTHYWNTSLLSLGHHLHSWGQQGLGSRFANCEQKSLHVPKFLTENQFQFFSCLKDFAPLRSTFHGKWRTGSSDHKWFKDNPATGNPSTQATYQICQCSACHQRKGDQLMNGNKERATWIHNWWKHALVVH